MDVLASVTCCFLAFVTLAVFRKEIAKVKDVVVGFWLPKKRKKQDDRKNKRQESNKENRAPLRPPPTDAVVKTTTQTQVEQKPQTKESVSVIETATKVIKETDGLRIKSATLLSDISPLLTDKPFESFTSTKLSDQPIGELENTKTHDAFPSYADLPQGPPKPPRSPTIDISTSSKREEISGDDQNFVKTTTETMKEVKGNKEISSIKKQQESVSKTSSSETNGIPDITLDTIDLNNLISATQKKLDTFKNGYKSDIAETSSNFYEMKKTETSSMKESRIFDSTNVTDNNSSLRNQESSAVANLLSDSIKDLENTTGSFGLTSSDMESSAVTSESPFGTMITTKKKKMFSSSSFYEEPYAIYPTVEEQVELAKKIADSLADDTNKKSKGANMFFKRVKRSTKWIHEGPEPSDESAPGTPEIQGVEPPTPDPSQVPWKTHKGPSKLKLVLDPRHTQDASTLRSSGFVISEHNVVSPEMCHGLVKDLHSPVGKGAALFAKRKKKSEEWVVDEEKVKALIRESEKHRCFTPPATAYNQYPTIGRQDVKLIKTPWEAAMESPYGSCDAAFMRVNPEELADTVIKAADYKRTNSVATNDPASRLDGCISPPVTPAAAYYDIYHAKAPKGWTSTAPSARDVYDSPVPPPLTNNIANEITSFQNNYPAKKMVFQNFNTVPRLWKKTTRN